jgi:hypothetical protein
MPKQGSTYAKGYGKDHEAQRRAWAPKVARGGVQCHAIKCLMPARTIGPRDEWHMGHTPDRSRWTGPEHPKCNTSEGGKRGRAQQLGTGGGLRHSRAW